RRLGDLFPTTPINQHFPFFLSGWVSWSLLAGRLPPEYGRVVGVPDEESATVRVHGVDEADVEDRFVRLIDRAHVVGEESGEPGSGRDALVARRQVVYAGPGLPTVPGSLVEWTGEAAAVDPQQPALRVERRGLLIEVLRWQDHRGLVDQILSLTLNL